MGAEPFRLLVEGRRRCVSSSAPRGSSDQGILAGLIAAPSWLKTSGEAAAVACNLSLGCLFSCRGRSRDAESENSRNEGKRSSLMCQAIVQGALMMPGGAAGAASARSATRTTDAPCVSGSDQMWCGQWVRGGSDARGAASLGIHVYIDPPRTLPAPHTATPHRSWQGEWRADMHVLA